MENNSSILCVCIIWSLYGYEDIIKHFVATFCFLQSALFEFNRPSIRTETMAYSVDKMALSFWLRY